jgi:cell division septum initiation protein DivIVA
MDLTEAFQSIVSSQGRFAVSDINRVPIDVPSYDKILESMGTLPKEENKIDQLDQLCIDSEKIIKRYKDLRKEIDTLKEEINERTEVTDKYMATERSMTDAINKFLLYQTATIAGFEKLDKEYVKKMHESIDATRKESDRILSLYAKKTNTLTAQLEKATTQLASLSSLVFTSVHNSLTEEERSRMASGKTCTICLERDINRVLECGHVLCNKCVENMSNKKCHMCRKAFTKPITIYFNGAEESSTSTVNESDQGFMRQNVFTNLYANV